MKNRKYSIFCLLIIMVFGITSPVSAASKDLSSYPIAKQEKKNWCWAAVSSSVLKFMTGENVYQCDFVKYVKSSTCNDVSATTEEAQSGMHHFGVSSNYYSGSLSMSQIKAQIDDGRPIYVSWKWNSPNALIGHAVAIYGYSDDSVKYLDPWEGVKTSLSYTNFKGGSDYDRTWRWGLRDFWDYK
ncbi:papain-like cysteine protease family protein [Paenibacillus aquistagni]|uniref:papain-like cysteine protease family protein n=1 Tax=Paenibacillus aquistagni TaxID=1852522 RepID=UPI00145A4B98|nr:papain-like cysteine protease family protein [Paenibacillus aquistagni]NMM55284.1 hypothetical protein [Paenibacillus aquistagni]